MTDLTILHLGPEPEPEDQAETVFDASPDQETGSSFTETVTVGILEICSPFETLDDPGSAVALLVVVGVVILAAISLIGLWNAVQEALSGGGPPPGLGLK